MWNGRWSRELDSLYDIYYSFFGIEPDCETGISFDDLSYNEFVKLIKKSIMQKKPLQQSTMSENS